MLMEPTDLKVEVLAVPGGTLLRLIGALDTTSADSFVADTDLLVQQGHRQLILDCGGLTFCDSDGLRALKILAERVRPDGLITIDRPSRALTRLLDLADLGADVILAPPVQTGATAGSSSGPDSA